MINYIPNHNVKIKNIWNDYKFIIDKICDIIFTKNYNDYCVKVARSILNFICETNLITSKQIILLMKLSPNKN